MVWDLENNSEISNYSMKGNFRYVQGSLSSSGYILTSTSYVNLDNGVANPFFDHDFTSFHRYFYASHSGGFKISSNEDIILDCGNVVMKTTYSEIVSLSGYLSGETIIEEGNFTFFNVKFQIDGNTALHLFALDESALN